MDNKIKVESKNDLEISKNYSKLINNDNKNINENTALYLDKYDKDKLEK